MYAYTDVCIYVHTYVHVFVYVYILPVYYQKDSTQHSDKVYLMSLEL